MTPPRAILAVAAAAGCAYIAYRFYKRTRARAYYKARDTETLVPAGLRCESWTKSGASEWIKINDVS
jgi:hypothetical protein